MSLLKSTYAEDFAPGGALLPEGWYKMTVEEAAPETVANGTRLNRRYGSITTKNGAAEFTLPNGETFRIGNRKAFAHSWIDHSNPIAQRIGNTEIKREAVATGLMDQPMKDGPPVELDFNSWSDYAERLVGQTVLVLIRHKRKQEKVGEKWVAMKDENGNPVMDIEVKDWAGV